MPKDKMAPPEQNFCSLLNISACQFTEVNKEASNLLLNFSHHFDFKFAKHVRLFQHTETVKFVIYEKIILRIF